MTSAAELVESAEHWERLADEAEALSARERELGIDGATAGNSVGDNQARLYRACAASLRSEAETGLAHCTCHGLALTRTSDGRSCEHVGTS